MKKSLLTILLLNIPWQLALSNGIPYEYTSFNGTAYNRIAYEGEHVVLFVPINLLNNDSLLVNKVVKLCDQFYEYYKNTLGYDPSGGHAAFGSKLGIGFVGDNFACGGALGLIGAKGIELGSGCWERILLEVRDSLSTSNIVTIPYEFGRNFFIFSSKILFPSEYEQNGGFAEAFANLFYLKAIQNSNFYNIKNSLWNETLYYENELYRLGLAYINNTNGNPDSVLAKNGFLNDKNRNIRGLNNPAAYPATGILFLLDSLFKDLSIYPNFFKELNQRNDASSMQDALDNIYLSACFAINKNLKAFFEETLNFKLSKEAIQNTNKLPIFINHKLVRDINYLYFTSLVDSINYTVSSLKPLGEDEYYSLSYFNNNRWDVIEKSKSGHFTIHTDKIPFLGLDTLQVRGAIIKSDGTILDHIESKLYYRVKKEFYTASTLRKESYIHYLSGASQNSEYFLIDNGFSIGGTIDSFWHSANITMPFWYEPDRIYRFQCQIKSNPPFKRNNGQILFENIWPTNGRIWLVYASNEIIHGAQRFGIDLDMQEGWNDYIYEHNTSVNPKPQFPTEVPWRIQFDITGFGIYQAEVRNLEVIDLTLFNKIQSILESTTSIVSNNSVLKWIKLYPNPTNNFMDIQSTKEPFTSINIYNQLGTKIYSQNYTSDNFARINISNLLPGIYIIIIESKNNKSSHKIIKT